MDSTTTMPALQLDARQRAMLLEMGVRTWPLEILRPPAQTRASTPAAATASRTPNPAPSFAPAAPPPSGEAAFATAPPATRPQPQPPQARTPHGAAPQGAASQAVLLAPRNMYPGTDPGTSPLPLGRAWLLVAESLQGHAAPTESAERLLDNMLRALGLHRHPQVHLCQITPASSSRAAGAEPPQAPEDALTHWITQLRPAVVLIMGSMAARHCLGHSGPLGPLRGQNHVIAGVPAVVTYDAPVLLRSPGLKAQAWEDLCRARALTKAPVTA